MRVAIQVRGAIYAAQAARRNRRARRRRRGDAACADSSPWASRAKRAAVAAVDAAVYLLLDSYPAVTTAQYLLRRTVVGSLGKYPATTRPQPTPPWLLHGITATHITAMYLFQHNYPAVSTAPCFLHRIMAG